MMHRGRPSGMRAVFVLAALLLLFVSAYEYGRVLHLRPQPMHLWRQSDCLAITLNYARGNGTFLEPEILSQIADKGATGKSAGELPLIYFLMGKLWAVIGPSEFTYRLFGLLMHMVGTFALFGALRRVVRSDFWSVASALLFFTSPVVVYYCVAFLPDVPAFDLALMGWYALVRFGEERRHRYWYIAAACFGLATLLKVTAGMSLIALCALLVIATVRPKWLGAERRLLPDLLPAWGAVAAVMACVLAWYVHAEVYNDAHGGRYTFNNLWPIWEMSPEKVDEAWHFAKDVLVFQVFDTSVWVLIGVAVVVLLVNARSVPRAAWWLNGSLVVGALAYCVLWFNALLFHDYYFINPQFALLVPWATFLWWMSRHHPEILQAHWSRWAMGALVLFNLAHAANNMHMRYNESGPLMRSGLLPVYHELELPYWNTISYGPMRDLPTITPFLREHGVLETDRVIFTDDGSINSALYLMGQPGYTRFGWDLDTSATYRYLIAQGARYLVFSEPTQEEKPWMRPYLRRPIGRHGSVQVFDLRGLDRLRPERSFIEIRTAPAEGPLVRADTLRSEGEALHFGSDRIPLEVSGITFDAPGTVSATLRVSGRVFRSCADPKGLNLVYEGPGEKGFKSYKAIPLTLGRFALDLLVPQPIKGHHRLLIENTTGTPFAVDSLVIEVERWVDPGLTPQ